MSSPVEMEKTTIPVANATPVAGTVPSPPPRITTGTTLHGGRHNPDREADTGVFRAILCFYQAFSLNIRCRGTGECLCLRKTACWECIECGPRGTRAQSRGVGILTGLQEDEYCRLGLHCCDYALIRPKILCGGASHVLCMRQVASFPHHPDYVDEWVCADYCLSCLPDCAIAAQPPKCPALDHMELELGVAAPAVMDRGDAARPVVVKGDYVQVAQAETDAETDSEVV